MPDRSTPVHPEDMAGGSNAAGPLDGPGGSNAARPLILPEVNGLYDGWTKQSEGVYTQKSSVPRELNPFEKQRRMKEQYPRDAKNEVANCEDFQIP